MINKIKTQNSEEEKICIKTSQTLNSDGGLEDGNCEGLEYTCKSNKKVRTDRKINYKKY